MSDWIVGETVATEYEIVLDNVPVTSGSAECRYWIQDGATKKWLQPDGTTFSTLEYAHPLSLSGTVWRRTFTVPASAAWHILYEEPRHSDGQDIAPQVEEHRVVVWAAAATFGNPSGGG